MGTLSKIALFLFLVVGLLASAQGPIPGTVNSDPFAGARATPLPTRAGFVPLDPTKAARFRDERLDYYQASDGGANWNGQAVMGVNGAGDQYQACRNTCATQNPQNAQCYADCDRRYVQSAATNTNQIYKFAPNGNASGSTNNGVVPQQGLQMPSALPNAREKTSVQDGNQMRNWGTVDSKRD